MRPSARRCLQRTFKFFKNENSHWFDSFFQEFGFVLIPVERISSIAFIESLASIFMNQSNFSFDHVADFSAIDIFKHWINFSFTVSIKFRGSHIRLCFLVLGSATVEYHTSVVSFPLYFMSLLIINEMNN